jgi:hypothetical protein
MLLLLSATFWCVALLAHPLFHLGAPNNDGCDDDCPLCAALQVVQPVVAVTVPEVQPVRGERVVPVALSAPPELPAPSLVSRAPPGPPEMAGGLLVLA